MAKVMVEELVVHINDLHMEGWFIKFHYDQEIVDLLKRTVPKEYREYNKIKRRWYVDKGSYWDEFKIQMESKGHEFISA